MTARATERAERDEQQGGDLAVGDAEERAEQQPGQAVEEPSVEADEERTAGQREGLDGPDDGGLVAVGLAARRSGGRGR